MSDGGDVTHRNWSTAQMSVFAGATRPDPVSTCSLSQLAEDIRGPRWSEVIDRLRQRLDAGDREAYDSMKRGLQAVTPGGTFEWRANDALIEHSGLVVIDIDGMSPRSAAAARDDLGDNPHVGLAFISPSGAGVKALVRIERVDGAPLDATSHRAAWAAAAKLVSDVTGHVVDESGKDVARLSFVSHDRDARYRPDSEPLRFEMPTESAEPLPADSGKKTTGTRPTAPASTDAISCGQCWLSATWPAVLADVSAAIPHDERRGRHVTLRAKSVYVGASLVGPGLLTRDVAIRGLLDALRGEHLDMELAFRTAASGVDLGRQNPRKLDENPQCLKHYPSKVRIIPVTNGKNGNVVAENARVQAECDARDDADRAALAVPTWPELEPIGSDDPPPVFPVEALPSWLRDMATATATAFQVPVELPALIGLATLGGAVQRRVIVRAAPDWTEPLSLFTLVGLPSGCRKSSVFAAMLSPVNQIEKELVDGYRAADARREARARILKKDIAKAENNGDQQGLTSLLLQMQEVEEQAAPRLVADEATVESLARILDQQGGRLLLASAESELIGLLARRYSDGRGPANLGVLLAGHAGDALRVDRIGRPSICVQRAALSLALCTQPVMLGELVGIRGASDRGLVARFMLSLPRHGLGHRDLDPPSVPLSVRAAYAAGMRELWLAAYDPETDPDELTLNADANRELAAYRSWIEPRLGHGGDLEDLRAEGGKSAGLAVRLAGLIHLPEMPTGATEIGAQVMARGIELARWALTSAQHVRDSLGATPELLAARAVLERIVIDGPRESLTYHALQRATRRAPIRSAKDFAAAVEELENRGYLRVTEERTAGRPRKTLMLNPVIFKADSPGQNGQKVESPPSDLLTLSTKGCSPKHLAQIEGEL